MPEIRYDVFLSHATADKPAVEELGRRLEREGISCWLDKWNLIPGESWRPALERGLRESETCLVFVGPSGFGPWHNEEIDLAIREGVERKPRPLRVIPVLLPGGKETADADLPGFLKGKMWVQFAQSLDEAEPFRRLVSGVHGIEPRYAPEEAPFSARSPYVGLRPFRGDEAPFFFGREGTVRQILARLGTWFGTRDERRFLAVLGPSGSGKSSVVAAGLIPALRKGGLPESEQWVYVTLKPGASPQESLQVALASHPELGQHAPAISDQLARSRGEGDRLRLAGKFVAAQSPTPRRLVVFVDQFEEVFSYARREHSAGSVEVKESKGSDGKGESKPDLLGADRRTFIDNLLRAIRDPDANVCVVIAMRADFYGHCAEVPEFRSTVSDNQILLGPMSRDELRGAIICPAQRCGLEVEPALVERLLEDMEQQPGALPFLQHTLEQLAKPESRSGRRLTVQAYDKMGSLEGAVDRYAEEYFKQLHETKQTQLKNTLLELIQLGEGASDTKRRRAVADLPGGDSPEGQQFIKDLADHNLVTTNRTLPDTEATKAEVELSHEALLRGWKRFQGWIDTSRDLLRLKERIEEAAREWKQNLNDESYLWQGGQLAGAEAEVAKCAFPLSSQSRSYLEACRQHRMALEQRERERQTRSKRRLQGLAFTGLALAVAAVVGLALATNRGRELSIAKATSDTASSNAIVQRNLALSNETIANVQLSEVNWLLADQAQGFQIQQQSPILATHRLLKAAFAEYQASRDPTMINAILGSQLSSKSLLASMVHDEGLAGARYSPDKQLVLTWGQDGAVRLWRSGDGRPLGKIMQHDSAVQQALFSPNGQWVLSWADELSLVRVSDGQRVDILNKSRGAIKNVLFSPDSERILSWAHDEALGLWQVQDGQPVGLPMKHEWQVTGAIFSPDGGRILSWTLQDWAQLWQASDGHPLGASMRNANWLSPPKFSPDGQKLLTWDYDGAVHVWRAQDGQAYSKLMQHKSRVRNAVFSPNGSRLIVFSDESSIHLWNVEDGQPLDTAMKQLKDVEGAKFSPDSQTIISWSSDGNCRLWSSVDGQPVGLPIRFEVAHVGARMIGTDLRVRFSPDNLRVLIWSFVGGIGHLWNAKDGQPVGSPLKHERYMSGAEFSEDGERLLTWSADGTARLWRATDGVPVGSPLTHEGPVKGASFGAHNHEVLTWSSDGVVRLWRVAPPVEPRISHDDTVNGAVFSADGQRVLSWSRDGSVRLCSTVDGKLLGSPMRHESSVNGAAFSPDNLRILSWSADGGVKLWQVSNTLAVGFPMKHEGGVLGASFSHKNQRILSWGRDNAVKVWRADNGEPSGVMFKHAGPVEGAVFSADGEQILSWGPFTAILWKATDSEAFGPPLSDPPDEAYGIAFTTGSLKYVLSWGNDRTARLRRSRDGQFIGRTMSHESSVQGATFSADGQMAVSWTFGDRAYVWRTVDGEPIGRPIKHDGPLDGAEFSPDGQQILTWSFDHTARLWRASDGEPAGNPMWHDGPVNGGIFHPDGTRILTWSSDGTVRLWDTSNHRRIAQFFAGQPIQFARLSPDGNCFLTGTGNSVQLWPIAVDRRVSLEYRLLEFEVRSATSLTDSGQIRVFTVRQWDERQRKLLEKELQSGLALTPSGQVRELTSDELAAKREQLDALRRTIN